MKTRAGRPNIDVPTEGSTQDTVAGEDRPRADEASSWETALVRGEVVDRYVILGMLGAGGMGVVYAAYDPDLDRKVALKFLRPGGGTDRKLAQARLRREAQAMAQLANPHVVAVHDVSVHNDRVYVAMEYIEGQTLTRWLAESKRSWQEVLAVFLEVGKGLAAAHAVGLMHRDVKPDNLMLDDQGRARVMDFGLALGTESAQPSAKKDSLITRHLGSQKVAQTDAQTGALQGTPAYMAPERYDAKGVDARTDQFSYCVAFWEALYGERPFAGENVAALYGAVASGKRRAVPSDRAATVPTWLRQTLDRGLSVDPDARWPTIDALLSALSYDPAHRRNRWLWAGGGLTVVGLVGLSAQQWVTARSQRCSGAQAQLAGVWDQPRREEVRAAVLGIEASYAEAAWRRTASTLDAYASAWTAMHTETCEATTVRGEQSSNAMDLRMACLRGAKMELSAATGVLGSADAAVVQNAHKVVEGLRPLSQCEDVAALEAESEPPRPEEAEAVEAVRDQLMEARAERKAGRYDVAETKVEAATQRLADDAVEYGPVRTEATLEAGLVHRMQGRYEASEAALRQALRSAARWDQREAMRDAATELLFVVGYLQRRFDEGLLYRELAAGLAEGTPAAEAGVLNNVANVHQAKGEYDEAATLHRRALAIRKKALGAEHPMVANSLSNLAVVYQAKGEYDEAARLHLLALDLREKALGAEHPEVAASLNNLANVHQVRGRYDEAETLHRRALAVRENALGAEHPKVATSLSNLAVLHQAKGEYDETVRLYGRALAIWKTSLGPEHPKMAAALSNLANVHYAKDEFDQAAALHERVLAIREKLLGAEHPDVGQSLYHLGAVHHSEGNFEEAAALYERALVIREKALGAEHPYVADTLLALADVALEQHRPTDAVVKAERAVQIREASTLPPTYVARARFLLARALAATGDLHGRAVVLAQQARDVYRDAGESSADLLEVQKWLDAHE